ncbi:MAG: hypothetical protein P8Z81_12175, partial [Deinococcales bacterium]
SAGLVAGVHRFEGALAGVCGCPFAGDMLVGNLPSERVLPWLKRRGHDAGIDVGALGALAADAADIAAVFAAAVDP